MSDLNELANALDSMTGPTPTGDDYLIYDRGAQSGPFSEREIRRRVTLGIITPTAQVWCEGMPQWMPVALAFPSQPQSAPARVRVKRTGCFPVFVWLLLLPFGAVVLWVLGGVFLRSTLPRSPDLYVTSTGGWVVTVANHDVGPIIIERVTINGRDVQRIYHDGVNTYPLELPATLQRGGQMTFYPGGGTGYPSTLLDLETDRGNLSYSLSNGK
jgi:hypothetical protein